MKIVININKDGLSTEECEDLADYLQFTNTEDVISLVEKNLHCFEIGKNKTKVKIKREE